MKEGALGSGKEARAGPDDSSPWGLSSLLPSRGTQESPWLTRPVLRQRILPPLGLLQEGRVRGPQQV